MTEERIRNTMAECAVGLTRHVMEIDKISHDEAYCKVLASELFELVNNSDTRLYLEPNAELSRLYDIEMAGGIDALYAAIA